MINTRLIETDDIPQLIELSRQGVKDHFSYLKFNEQKVTDIFSSCISLQSHFDCLISEISPLVMGHSSKIIGYLLFMITPHLYAEGTCASVLALYITPSYRGTQAAHYLLTMLKDITTRLQTEEVHIATNSMYKIEQTKAFLSRNGFTYCGTSHILKKHSND